MPANLSTGVGTTASNPTLLPATAAACEEPRFRNYDVFLSVYQAWTAELTFRLRADLGLKC